MTFTNLEKCVYSKKCLKQRRQPPTPPSSKVEGILAPKMSPGYGCYLQLNMPIQHVSFIVHLKRLFPTAQDQEDYFKTASSVSEQLSQIIEYVQLNKTAYIYTDVWSLFMSSTWVVALVPTSTSASIKLISIWLV